MCILYNNNVSFDSDEALIRIKGCGIIEFCRNVPFFDIFTSWIEYFSFGKHCLGLCPAPNIKEPERMFEVHFNRIIPHLRRQLVHIIIRGRKKNTFRVPCAFALLFCLPADVIIYGILRSFSLQKRFRGKSGKREILTFQDHSLKLYELVPHCLP